MLLMIVPSGRDACMSEREGERRGPGHIPTRHLYTHVIIIHLYMYT